MRTSNDSLRMSVSPSRPLATVWHSKVTRPPSSRRELPRRPSRMRLATCGLSSTTSTRSVRTMSAGSPAAMRATTSSRRATPPASERSKATPTPRISGGSARVHLTRPFTGKALSSPGNESTSRISAPSGRRRSVRTNVPPVEMLSVTSSLASAYATVSVRSSRGSRRRSSMAGMSLLPSDARLQLRDAPRARDRRQRRDAREDEDRRRRQEAVSQRMRDVVDLTDEPRRDRVAERVDREEVRAGRGGAELGRHDVVERRQDRSDVERAEEHADREHRVDHRGVAREERGADAGSGDEHAEGAGEQAPAPRPAALEAVGDERPGEHAGGGEEHDGREAQVRLVDAHLVAAEERAQHERRPPGEERAGEEAREDPGDEDPHHRRDRRRRAEGNLHADRPPVDLRLRVPLAHEEDERREREPGQTDDEEGGPPAPVAGDEAAHDEPDRAAEDGAELEDAHRAGAARLGEAIADQRRGGGRVGRLADPDGGAGGEHAAEALREPGRRGGDAPHADADGDQALPEIPVG